MSNALTPDAPETDLAAPPVGEPAPGDGTAVAEGSAGAEAKTVDANRFNGLMAAHQKALNELAEQKTQLAELAARINQGDPQPVSDGNDAVLARLDAMEQRAMKAERKAALAEVLKRHPEAAPFADIITADTPEDLEAVAAAVALRVKALGTTEPPAPEGEPAPTTEPPAAEEPEAPVIGGGTAAPGEPSVTEAVQEALAEGSWAKFWTAKSGAKASQNLA